MNKTITLRKAAQVPLNGPIRPSGFTAEVDEETYQSLRDRGVLAESQPAAPEPEQGTPDEPDDVDPAPEAESHADKKYPPLPKKTAGVNVLREYARDNNIDIRGLSDKAEIMGHLMKVTSQ